DGGNVVEVSAVSYKKLLGSRHVGPGPLRYDQMDQGDIVWNLIEHTQAKVGGSWGITKGQTATGILRDREYVPGDNIGELAKNLQEVIDGLWFDVDIDKVLMAAMPDSFTTIPVPLQLGVNARKMQ